jgi:hypothetical protein
VAVDRGPAPCSCMPAGEAFVRPMFTHSEFLTPLSMPRVVTTFAFTAAALVSSSCGGASQDGQPRAEREQPPPNITWPIDPSCVPPPGADSGLDISPELVNRSETWDSAMAEYNRTGRQTEAVVDVYVHLDEQGMPLCAAPERVAGDSLLRSIVVRAALRSRWTPAFRAGQPVESVVRLGFGLCREDAVEVEQHMHWCSPPSFPTIRSPSDSR